MLPRRRHRSRYHQAAVLNTRVGRPGPMWPVPIPSELSLQLSASVERWGSRWIVTDGHGGQASPWSIERAMRSARKRVPGLPAEFRFHDLRHYYASLLIADGADIKEVQTRLRHASAKTTYDTYLHLWPDANESTRATVGAVIAARMDSLAGLTEQSRNRVGEP